jgi:hypothetical protein
MLGARRITYSMTSRCGTRQKRATGTQRRDRPVAGHPEIDWYPWLSGTYAASLAGEQPAADPLIAETACI